MFADDTKIIIDGGHDQDKVNQECNNLMSWFSAHGLLVNPNKCAIVNFSGKKIQQTNVINLNSFAIKAVPETKDLGITINNNLNWTTHTVNILTKAVNIQT